MRAPQHDVFPIVTLVRRRVTRCAAAPSKPSVAFWPGTGPSVRLTGAAADRHRARQVGRHVVERERHRAEIGSLRVDEDRVRAAHREQLRVSMNPPFRPTGVA